MKRANRSRVTRRGVVALELTPAQARALSKAAGHTLRGSCELFLDEREVNAAVRALQLLDEARADAGVPAEVTS